MHSNREDIVKLLISKENIAKLIVGVPDEHGQTALHWAASNGNIAICTELVKIMTPKGIRTEMLGRKQTALHFAVHGNHLDIVKLLIKEGGPELADVPDEHGQTALHWAASNGNIAICTELVKIMTPKGIRTEMLGRKQTALHFAVHAENLEVVKTIVELSKDNEGVGLIESADKSGLSPLAYAKAHANNPALIKIAEYLEEVLKK